MQLRANTGTVVVFDLDDTLYKEIDFVRSAYETICKTLIDPADYSMALEQMWDDFHHKVEVFPRLIDRFNLSIDVMEVVRIYREHSPNIELVDGALELLNGLEQVGARAALITDGRALTQTNKLRALAIEHFFAPIVISEVFGSEKPNERNYRSIEHTYPGCKYVYIGDNFSKDFITPNRLGWTTVGLKDDGRNIHSQSTEVAQQNLPQYLVESLRDIILTGCN